MLRKETVSTELLETLKTLMQMPSLKNYRLVGGTALALQIGHRLSIDIDLFSDKRNDDENILVELQQTFGKNFAQGRRVSGAMGKGISVFINNIKTDILDWDTKFIRPELSDEELRLASKEEIVTMKFNTFLCAPEFARFEKKDFVDIAFLLKDFSLSEMINLYKEKYPNQIIADRQILEGLVLYELAEKKVMPIMLNGVTWEDVKQQIDIAIFNYTKGHIQN